MKQAPIESYEFKIPKSDLDEIKRVCLKPAKRFAIISLVLSAVFIVLAAIEFSATYVEFGLAVLFGFLSAMMFLSVKNAAATHDLQKTYPDDYCRKIRIYDEFISFETSAGDGIDFFTTEPKDRVSLFAKTDKYVILLFMKTYAFPIPKEIIPEGSFINTVCAKGKRSRGEPQKKVYFEPISILKESFSTPSGDGTFTEGLKTESDFSFFTEVSDEPKKTQSSESSAPPRYLYETIIKKNEAQGLKTAGVVTFVLTILAAALVSPMGIVLEIAGLSFAYTLILLAPAIACLVIGIILLSKNERGLRNVIASVIALFLIVSIGTSDLNTYSPEPEALEYVLEIEEKFGIDVPDSEENLYYYKYDETDDYHHSLSIHIGGEDFADLEAALARDERFVTVFPTSHIGLLPAYDRANDFAYAFIYNETDGRYNSIPDKEGVYTMCFISLTDYGDGSGIFSVTSYDVEYSKSFGTKGADA